MLKNFCLLFLFFFSINISQAQLEKVLHQTFLLDEIDMVALNVAGDVTIEQWAGNTIMTETRVKIYEGSQGIINYFVKAGRYDIVQEELDTADTAGIRLNSKDNIRRPIKTQTGECYEEVFVRVFIPEDFQDDGKGQLQRIIEEETNTPTNDSLQQTSIGVDSTTVDTSMVVEKPADGK